MASMPMAQPELLPFFGNLITMDGAYQQPAWTAPQVVDPTPQWVLTMVMPGSQPPTPPAAYAPNGDFYSQMQAWTPEVPEQNWLYPAPVSHSLAGRVWSMAQTRDGCRTVQRALDEAPNDDIRQELAAELRGHTWEALRCPHANHVLQKCIMTTRPQMSQFIIDELMPCRASGWMAAKAARHKYGCRVVQRLLEHCSPEQVQPLVEAFLDSAIPLCKHEFANYVMQHVLEHGTQDQRGLLIHALQEHAGVVGLDRNACAVLAKALTLGCDADRVQLAQAIANERGLVTGMARSRHGHTAVKCVLQSLDGREKEKVVLQLFNNAASLRRSRYGRSVMGIISPSMPNNNSFPQAAARGGA